MSFEKNTRSNSSTNEFDLAKETFKMLMAKMGDYEKLVELQTAVADASYDTARAVQAMSPHFGELRIQIMELRAQLDTLRTQQAQIIMEAILIRKDLDILLDLFGDVATYAKDDKQQPQAN